MKLIFVRHGETDWNKQKKLMGRVDIELNEEGRRQCNELVERLDGNFDAVFSSPLKRAHETAEFIARRFDKSLIVKTDLTERDFGTLAGKSWAAIQDESGEDMRAAAKDGRYDFRPFGGESAEQVKTRVLRCIDELTSLPYSNVVVVCHSGIIALMHQLFPREEISPISNTSVHVFDLNS